MCLRYFYPYRSDQGGWVSGETRRVCERVFEAAIDRLMGAPGPYPPDRVHAMRRAVDALSDEARWPIDGITVQPWAVPGWEAQAA